MCAARQLGAVKPSAGAAKYDIQLLETVAAELPSGAHRTAVQAALDAGRKFAQDGVPPQAVLLAANHKLEFGLAETC